jgi:hypothetical protein
MIPEIQQKALATLSQLCELSEESSDDIRLGQLVAWLGDLGMNEFGRRLADLEDDELLAVMYRHRECLLGRLPEQQQKAFLAKSATLPMAEGSLVADTPSSAEIGH